MSRHFPQSPVPVRPTAWFWWVAALVSLISTIVLGVFGAFASFAGGDLGFAHNGWSILFWVLILFAIALFCVSIVLLPATRRREARVGYTTVPAMVRGLEWRDHATGLVLRKAGEPTPTGSITDLRKAARGRSNGLL